MPGRTLKQQHPAVREDIADLRTVSPLPGGTNGRLDPFLLLNHHGPQVYAPGNHGLPFGPHPHRGMETVTFILEGELAHQDSGGHDSVIGPGGVQWMTAGRGLVHAEVSPEGFRRAGGPLEILQLWVNLPAKLKLTTPRYSGLQDAEIPTARADEGRVVLRPVSGRWEGKSGPFESLTGVALVTLHMQAGGRIVLPAPAARTVFLYVVRGSVQVGGQPMASERLAELNADGDEVELLAEEASVVIFGHAAPLGEPVVWHGPFVMNSEAEIVQAIRDYQAGKFDGPGG